MMKFLYLFLILVLCFNTSCASLLHGTKEKIYLESQVPGTQLYIDDEFLGIDQVASYVRKKDLKEVRLIGRKVGCQPVEKPILTQFDSTTLFGLFIDFGLISILLVDWGINGAVMEAEIARYVLNPICPATL